MKNLQNYGVQELDTQELQTTDGGLIGVIFLSTLLICGPMLAWASGHTVVGQPNGASA
jgi:hypothetical protein